jgi:putative transposase
LKLTLKYQPNLDKTQVKIIEELSFHTTKLYNTANYACRENVFQSYGALEKAMKSNWHRAYLHSHTYQQCLKVLEQNWKSYFKAAADYKKKPDKYYGKPQPPKYKNTNDRKNEVIFTAYAIRRKNKEIGLSLSKPMQQKFQVNSLKVEVNDKLPLPEQAIIKQIRLQWDQVQQQWSFLILYQAKTAEPLKYKNIMSIDLGLDNLAAITFSHHPDTYLICGRSLKSKNSYYNQKIAHFQSIRMKQTSSERFRNTDRIRRLQQKRRNTIHNALHQASRTILNLAKQHQAGTIVIGDLKGIKQGSSIKSFVQIPIGRLVDMITYKAELDGRIVIRQNERYTSGVSAFDLETINKENYDKTRRIKRGLFRTESGLLVNADVNGSLNILRKQMAEGIPYLIQSVRDNGCVNHPRRIRVA